MTTSRKAQEEEIRDLIRAKSSRYSGLHVHGTHATPGEILSLVEELGYRKLPKNKPPLLNDGDIVLFLKSRYPHMYKGNDETWCRSRESALLLLLHSHIFDTELLLESQRDADTRHYEGK